MVKHNQAICRQFADELFECVCDDFVGLELKGLTWYKVITQSNKRQFEIPFNWRRLIISLKNFMLKISVLSYE